MAEGIDIYAAYQKVTNSRSVRGSNRLFCYVKLSDGVTTRNDNGYCASLRGAGVTVGGYHYAQPGDPVRQANLFIDRCVARDATGLAPALDLEAPFTPNRTAVNFAVAFCRQVAARGHRPCLYANNTMMRTVRSAVKTAVPQTVIWVARYGASPTVAFDVWQYSQFGHVPGIAAGSVDLDKGVIPYNVAGAAGATALAAGGDEIERLLNSMNKDELKALVADGVRDYFNPAWHTSHVPGSPTKVSLRDAILNADAYTYQLKHFFNDPGSFQSRIPGDKNKTNGSDAVADTVARVSMNQGTLNQLKAQVAGLQAAVTELAKNSNVSAEQLQAMINDAVAQHVNITGTVSINSSDTEEGSA